MKFIKKLLTLGTILSLAALGFSPFPRVAEAASLLNKSDTLSSLKTSTASNHTIVFRTPTGANQSTDTITITFPSGWAFGAVAFGDLDLDHSAGSQSNCTSPTYSNSETLAASATGSAWGFATSSQVMTLTPPTDGVGASAIAADACVRIKIGTNASGGTNQVTNNSSTGAASIAVAGSFGDSGDIVVYLLSDDQVAVSATVDESLSFSISDNSIGFGTLSSSAARYATGDGAGDVSEAGAHDVVVGTNAANGYTLTATGTTLTSGANTITAIGSSNTASSAGSEQFGIRATATGGSGAVSAPYAASGFAFDTAAFPDEVAASTGPSADTTYSVRYLANISSNTEAGAYTSTITYTATANF